MKKLLFVMMAAVAALSLSSCEQNLSDRTYVNRLIGVWSVTQIDEVTYLNGELAGEESEYLSGSKAYTFDFRKDNTMVRTQTVLGQDVTTTYDYNVTEGTLELRLAGAQSAIVQRYDIERVTHSELIIKQEVVEGDEYEVTRYYFKRK